MRRLVSLLLLIPLAACIGGGDSADPAGSAPGPRVNIDGSTDLADRDCNVVLRSLERQDDGSGGFVQAGTSWVWSGTIEVSTAAAAQGLAPQIMWVRADLAGVTGRGAATWSTAEATEVDDGTATPGYVKYQVSIDHDAAGPLDPDAYAVAVYLPLGLGGRLFDHNREPGDFDNYTLGPDDFAVYDDAGTCKAPSTPSAATLSFNADFSTSRTGVLTPGGTLTVHYDSTRLAQCAVGSSWDVTAFVQFDTGELLETSVLGVDATFSVPTDGPTTVSLWFEGQNPSGCQAWDSNFGNNYVFHLAETPQWVGLATNTLSRDDSVKCGAADATAGFSFDTWARTRAVETNLCFQVYLPGETDAHDPDLWEIFDTELHWRLTGAGGAVTAWQATPVDVSDFEGNNANYAFSWRTIDPFRDFHCPEVPSTPTSDGMYQQIGVEYFVTVNGVTLEEQHDGDDAFPGTFIDYPSNPWRDANCGSGSN